MAQRMTLDSSYGSAAADLESPPPNSHARKRSWSMHETSPLVGGASGNGSNSGNHAAATTPSMVETVAAGWKKPVLTKSMSTDRRVPPRLPPTNSSTTSLAGNNIEPKRRIHTVPATPEAPSSSQKGGLPYYVIYAIVNVIISLPGLYGYAAVIFNHPVFQPHMNALSKLVIFSSLVHQFGFLCFSTLPFAIGTVQDAGLIFLSSMSNTIAKAILDGEGGSEEMVVSTTLVLLSLGTAMLGLVLIAMGRFRMANAVSYLPMPVVGGYLAFIGYFCLQAGVALCISESIMSILDWKYLADPHLLLLATPGLLAGMIMTWISRNVKHDVALPLAMVLIPALFYVILLVTDVSMDEARDGGWVGPVAPPVPLSDLLHLVDFSLVRWDLISNCLATWMGMVFVVSFASCLDVAAISMDMGEALDTNKELATVGICNFMSGLTFGFTGSYIFSQTIFTYRTGVHSRWIGVFIMLVFMYVVASPMNILQVSPLFFLGSTLIFIGYDLLYEWLIEIRHKIFLSEYAIVWATFIAIQVVGIDVGIVLGVLVAIVDHVVMTAQTSSVNRVSKRSRAMWTPSDYKLLHDYGYHAQNPKIVTLEIIGTVFFGSSLQLLESISEEIGLNLQMEDKVNPEALLRSPHRSSYLLNQEHRRMSSLSRVESSPKPNNKGLLLRQTQRRPPKFVVLDLTQVPNLDASAARGCFLQLAKTCAKRGMIVCAAGASPRVDWMLRSHEVAYELDEEDRLKALLQSRHNNPAIGSSVRDDNHGDIGNRSHQATTMVDSSACERVLLFLTIYEALEFCEYVLLLEISANGSNTPSLRLLRLVDPSTGKLVEEQYSIARIFAHILGLNDDERKVVDSLALSGQRYHTELTFSAGDTVYTNGTHAGAFYVVLSGAVASSKETKGKNTIVSGAGKVRKVGSHSALLDPALLATHAGLGELSTFWSTGGIFGHVDFILERPHRVHTVATQDGTVVAEFTRSQMALVRDENPALDGILQRVLLQASVLDLANCT